MAYASVAEVDEITGTTVTTAQITRAQHIIEMVTNRTESASGSMKTKDLHWLKLATAYQAAHVVAKPELFTAEGLSAISQLDLSLSFTDAQAENPFMAPMAIRALKNCSWMRTRSVHLRTIFTDRG